MTPRQIELVQESFRKLWPVKDAAAQLFYKRLFEIEPGVRPLFKGEIREQGRELMAAIAAIVEGLDELDELVPAVQKFARQHVGYGVRPEHYEPVGAALLWMLEQGLGNAFSDDVRAAWATVYGYLSTTMIEAAYPKAA